MPATDHIHLQRRLGYTFEDDELLLRALTHPSWLQEHPEVERNNQRLEFLGDAVLSLVITHALFDLYPEQREGDLSTQRSALTKGTYQAKLAQELELGQYLLLSQTEEDGGGRSRDSSLEDAFEAVLGAVYIDGGFAAASNVIHHIYGDLPLRLDEIVISINPKGQLQERVQPTLGNDALRYETNHASGRDHERQYEAHVYLQDKRIGSGLGTSKKSAEENAARAALRSPALPPASR